MEVFLENEEETAQFASKFSRQLSPGDVCLLRGELGSGKTFFVTEVCRALGTDVRLCSSPTFTLVNIYPLKKASIYHVDLYRVDSVDLADAIDAEEWLNPDGGYTFIEWPEALGTLTPPKAWRLDFFHQGQGRKLNITEPDA